MMMVRATLPVCLCLACGPVVAEDYFGSREEAKALADALISIVEDAGIEAAVEAMHDSTHPFVSSRMGINLFQGSIIVADNREPETVAADYREIADLTGTIVWPLIAEAAAVEDDAVLKWYHYDTQEIYDYRCFSKAAARVEATVMVCR